MNDSHACDEQTLKELNIISESMDIFLAPFILFIVLVALASLTAVIGNGLIIATILKTPNLQKPSYLLITSMAVIDLLLALIFYPLFIVMMVWRLRQDIDSICRTDHAYHMCGFFFFAVSFMASLLISLDRYLAITLKHRYRLTVTKMRVLCAIALTFLSMALLVAIVSIDPIVLYWNLISGIIGFLILSLTCGLYIKSYVALRQIMSHVKKQHSNTSHTNFDAVKYKKSLKTVVMILAWLLACSLPILLARYAIAKSGITTKVSVILDYISIVAFSINSCTNPAIYIWRFRDIRKAYTEIVNPNANARCSTTEHTTEHSTENFSLNTCHTLNTGH